MIFALSLSLAFFPMVQLNKYKFKEKKDYPCNVQWGNGNLEKYDTICMKPESQRSLNLLSTFIRNFKLHYRFIQAAISLPII